MGFYRECATGSFIAHDCMAHTSDENGTTWEEIQALGVTLYLMSKNSPNIFEVPAISIPEMLIRFVEKERWQI